MPTERPSTPNPIGGPAEVKGECGTPAAGAVAEKLVPHNVWTDGFAGNRDLSVTVLNKAPAGGCVVTVQAYEPANPPAVPNPKQVAGTPTVTVGHGESSGFGLSMAKDQYFVVICQSPHTVKEGCKFEWRVDRVPS